MCYSSLFRNVVRAAQVEKLDAEQLEVAIQERNKPLIIDFYATWCGPCLLLAKELEQVSVMSAQLPHDTACLLHLAHCWLPAVLQVYETMGDSIRIVKVDTDENPDLSSQLQVRVAAHHLKRPALPVPKRMRELAGTTSVCSCPAQIQGLPTMVFVGLDRNKPALRTEGLLPADTIMDIIRTELMEEQAIDVGATAVE
jgi:thiol-disulfide isomerase/thioredoxin